MGSIRYMSMKTKTRDIINKMNATINIFSINPNTLSYAGLNNKGSFRLLLIVCDILFSFYLKSLITGECNK